MAMTMAMAMAMVITKEERRVTESTGNKYLKNYLT